MTRNPFLGATTFACGSYWYLSNEKKGLVSDHSVRTQPYGYHPKKRLNLQDSPISSACIDITPRDVSVILDIVNTSDFRDRLFQKIDLIRVVVCRTVRGVESRPHDPCGSVNIIFIIEGSSVGPQRLLHIGMLRIAIVEEINDVSLECIRNIRDGKIRDGWILPEVGHVYGLLGRNYQRSASDQFLYAGAVCSVSQEREDGSARDSEVCGSIRQCLDCIIDIFDHEFVLRASIRSWPSREGAFC